MKIKINNTVSIDLAKLVESRAVFLANSGAGKSWLIRRVAEQSVSKIQTIILDPEGEFSTLREKHDFILAGKDADVPVETRSASLLATKLLELNKSAVIDLYELHPQERQRYVKLFCDALVNCPKHLYHPVLIILDEAHDYVPEGKPSEATYSVEALASKGRKRGQCLILASQRISKLSKNAAAECNNKLIGRASQDIDMKRAGDELGFTKDRMFELRQLKPGEFFAFGPAISDEVQKVTVGEVYTTHAKIGYRKAVKTPPPSAVIKEVLAELKDLPQEAEKEARTVKDLKAENALLKRENTRLQSSKQESAEAAAIQSGLLKLQELLKAERAASARLLKQWIDYADSIIAKVNGFAEYLQKGIAGLKRPENGVRESKGNYYKSEKDLRVDSRVKFKNGSGIEFAPSSTEMHARDKEAFETYQNGMSVEYAKDIGAGEKKILTAIAQHQRISREHLTVLTGYKRSTRDRYIQRLTLAGLVEAREGFILATQKGLEFLGDDFEPLPTGRELVEHLLETLPEGERKIFSVLLEKGETEREALTEITGFKRSTRDRYLQRMKARKLVSYLGRGMVKLSEHVLQ